VSPFDEFEVCRNILESLLTGVCVVNMQRKIVFWSDGAARITGHPRHEVIGHSCMAETLLHCHESGCCESSHGECAMSRAIKTAQHIETVGFLHHKSGYEVPVRVRAVPVHNQHGSIIGAVETFDELENDRHGPEEDLPGYVDTVTGLPSPALMQSHLREAVRAFDELQVPFGVLRLRLQGLEHFRAAFGPDAASSFLRVVARSLAGDLGNTASVGRWTEDEFLVILNNCGEEAFNTVRGELRGMLTNNSIEWWGEKHSLPIVMGGATAQLGDTMPTLVDRVQESLDTALETLIRTTAAGNDGPAGS